MALRAKRTCQCVDCNRSHTEVQRQTAYFSAVLWTDIPSMSLPCIDVV